MSAEKKHAELVAQDKANKAIARAPSSVKNVNGGAQGTAPLSPEEASAAAQRDELMGAEKRLKQTANPSSHIGEGLEGMGGGCLFLRQWCTCWVVNCCVVLEMQY